MAKIRLGQEWEHLEVRITPSSVPDGFTVTPIVNGAYKAVAGEFAPDGRFFIAQQDGTIQIVKDGVLLAEPFTKLVTEEFQERGLSGLVLDPNFADNGFIYVYYTVPATAEREAFNRLSRLTAHGDQMLAGSEFVVQEFPGLGTVAVHNGGALRFANDGTLLVAIGDNGNGLLSQDLSNVFGSIVRINSDGSVPDDNPFVGVEGVDPRIWAYGLRNPFTTAVQRSTGEIFINDVGGNRFEEINRGTPGANYGWPSTEGFTSNPNFTSPIYAYPHMANGSAIAGAVFYEPTESRFGSEFFGKYFFGDFVQGTIQVFDPETGEVTLFASGFDLIVDLDIDSLGRLWVTTFNFSGGTDVHVVDLPSNLAPEISLQPQSRLVVLGEPVEFQVTAFGSPELQYQWFRNGEPLAGETSSRLRLASVQASDDGAEFSVRITNQNGSQLSQVARLDVTTNQPPTINFLSPSINQTAAAGDVIVFSASALDLVEGELPPEAFSWTMNYQTGSVVRPLLGPLVGITEGSFSIPRVTPYLETDVAWLVTVTVTSPNGLTRSETRTILPETTTITLNSTVANAVFLNGIPVNRGEPLDSVVGLERPLFAWLRVEEDGITYEFQRWSDNGPRQRDIIVPAEGLDLFAIYAPLNPPVVPGTPPAIPSVPPSVPDLPPASPTVPGTPPTVPGTPPAVPEVSAPANSNDHFAVAAGPGSLPLVQIFDATTRTMIHEFLAFEDSFTGGVRVAVADFNGDGIPDYVVTPGFGGGPIVRIFDGKTLETLANFFVFEPEFRGGVYVSTGEFNGDEQPELVVSAGEGGGPRVRVLDGKTFETVADFFGIDDVNFRGGARVNVGDLNGDGQVDLLVSAGEGGGPRVAAYSGLNLQPGRVPEKLFEDFFIFEPQLRDGVYVTLLDINGDGFADPVFGAGNGGAPRVTALSGRDLVESGERTVLANFFAGDVNSRTGVTVAAMPSRTGLPPELFTAVGGSATINFYPSSIFTQNEGEPDSLELSLSFRGGVFVS